MTVFLKSVKVTGHGSSEAFHKAGSHSPYDGLHEIPFEIKSLGLWFSLRPLVWTQIQAIMHLDLFLWKRRRHGIRIQEGCVAHANGKRLQIKAVAGRR